MQCPGCGAENTYGLRYCKHCGGSLHLVAAGAAAETGYRKLTGMFWAIAVFSMISLIALFGITIPLTIVGATRQVMVILIAFGAGAIFGVSWLLIQQLSRLIDLLEKGDRQARRITASVAQDYPKIAAPPRHISSVTENTTRNFDNTLYEEPRARD